MARGKEEGAVIGIILLFLLLIPSVEGAVQNRLYCIKSFKCYNGTTEGYIMSYVWETTSPRQSMRVALSVDRPAYGVLDAIQTMIRTDGYFTRDSGWWYIVKNADLNLTFFYPNGTVAKSIIGQKTDSTGIWENKTAFFLEKSYPLGRYKANASVRGPATGAPGDAVSLSGLSINGVNMTVYFDVGGELNLTLSSIPFGSKNNNISINGTVYQPNGQVFNSTFVQGLGSFSYGVNVSVTRPDLIIDRFDYTTTNGSYYLSYNATKVGTYYVIAEVEYDLGNQALRGKHTTGRVAQKFIVYGTWPEVGLSFAPTPLGLIISTLFAFYLRRMRHAE